MHLVPLQSVQRLQSTAASSTAASSTAASSTTAAAISTTAVGPRPVTAPSQPGCSHLHRRAAPAPTCARNAAASHSHHRPAPAPTGAPNAATRIHCVATSSSVHGYNSAVVHCSAAAIHVQLSPWQW